MPKLNLRLSESMRRKLERAANHNGRSMQTEILHRLEVSFRDASVQRAMEEAAAAREARGGRAVTQEDLNELRQEFRKQLGIIKGEKDEGTS